MSGTAAIRVGYRFIDGYHVYTSEDVYGLYVANRDPRVAYQAVAPSLEKLILLNEGISCRVEPALTFSEPVRSARHPDEPPVNEVTSRSFIASGLNDGDAPLPPGGILAGVGAPRVPSRVGGSRPWLLLAGSRRAPFPGAAA